MNLANPNTWQMIVQNIPYEKNTLFNVYNIYALRLGIISKSSGSG
jgi:hypothetical protein